jgi:hypothetical protein
VSDTEVRLNGKGDDASSNVFATLASHHINFGQREGLLQFDEEPLGRHSVLLRQDAEQPNWLCYVLYLRSVMRVQLNRFPHGH